MKIAVHGVKGVPSVWVCSKGECVTFNFGDKEPFVFDLNAVVDSIREDICKQVER